MSPSDDEVIIIDPGDFSDDEYEEAPVVIFTDDEDEGVPIVLIDDEDDEYDEGIGNSEDDGVPIVIVTEDDLRADAAATLTEEIVEELTEEIGEELGEIDLLAAIGDAIDEELDEELEFERSDRRILSLPRAYFAATLLTVPLLGILFAVGRTYYSLPLSDRPFHYLHEALRPSGGIGLSLGVAGTLLMFASMTYIVRKRLIIWRGLGAVKSWLGFHIFTGLIGPALIIFHAALVPQSAMGLLGLAAMLCVVLSGVVGRYVYAFAPKSLGGSELDFEVVRRRLTVFRNKLIEFGVNPSLVQEDVVEEPRGRSLWLFTAVAGVIYGDRDSRAEYARLKEAVCATKGLPDQIERTLLLARKLCRERQWAARYSEIRKLMGTWRFMHRWLAIVLVVAVFYHVLLSVKFGNLWIF